MKLTRQGVRDLNYLQPKRRPLQIPLCQIGQHRWSDWKGDFSGFWQERKCWSCKTTETSERSVW